VVDFVLNVAANAEKRANPQNWSRKVREGMIAASLQVSERARIVLIVIYFQILKLSADGSFAP